MIKTGSPMQEVLQYYMPQITASNVLSHLDLTSQKYFLVSAHREENIEADSSFTKLVRVLNTLAEKYNLPVIVSTHPRTQNRITSSGAKFHNLVRLMKPLGFHDYVKLQTQAMAVLSDSGTITEESSILDFPALNIREAHERPEGMEEASVVMVGLDPGRVLQALELIKTSGKTDVREYRKVRDYDVDNVSKKVVRIIHSYVDYVNRTVWKKYG